MALQQQPVNINFQQGVETKSDPWQVPVGKFASLENSVFTVGGRLTKRAGFQPYPKIISSSGSFTFQDFGASVDAGVHVSIFNDELILLDGMNLFSYAPATGRWIYKGRIETTSVENVSVSRSQRNCITPDSAINETTGLSLYAWNEVDGDPLNTPIGGLNVYGIKFSLFDTTTNQALINAGSVGDSLSSRPKCIAIGSSLYLFYLGFDGVNTTIVGVPITSAGAGTPVTLVTDIDDTVTIFNPSTPYANFDVQVIGSNIYFAYNGAGTTVKVASFTSALSAVATVSKAAESASNGIGLFSDASNNVWVAYNNGTATKAFIMDSALSTTVLAPTVVDAAAGAARNVTGIHDGTRGIIFYDYPDIQPVLNSLGIASSSFTQPAVGSPVSVTIPDTDLISPYVGQIVFIQAGGYYQVGAISSSTIFTAVNLGYAGNAAPGATVTGNFFLSVGTFSNALTNYNTLTSAGSVGTASVFLRACALGSRAFLYNGIAHVVAANASYLQPTYFLCSLYNVGSGVAANISAKVSPSEGGSIPYLGSLPQVTLKADGNYSLALLKQSSLVTYTRNGVAFSYRSCGVIDTAFDFSPTAISSKNLGNNLHFGLGQPMMYDGANVVEHGFNLYPEPVAISITGGTSQLAAGTYGYAVTYEWIDNQGQTHRSAPSPVVSIVVTAGQTVQLRIPTLRTTAKSGVVIAVYRTAVNGTIYYRLNAIGNQITYNSTSTNSVSYIDDVADDSIIGNDQLYTTGEVENIQAPATTGLAAFKNRLFAIDSENPNSFWYSKQVIQGSPVEFTDLFVINSGSIGGRLTGLGLLDDKIILFKGQSIYYMVGEGPAASGANNDFSDPIFVTSDCGNIDLLSIVVMPLGLMFKSDKGIYLLDRSLATKYVGSDVAAYNSVSVSSSLLMEKSNEVRFHLSDGTVLVYDYFYDQWDTWPALSSVSSVIFQGEHVFLKSNGDVLKQTPGNYNDDASPVDIAFTTGWINVAGLQGFERAYCFYILAKYYSAHTLTVGIAYDYDDTIVQTSTITPDSTESVEQWRIFFERQKCEAFQVTVQESSDGTGQGLAISGLNLIIGIKDVKPKLKAARSVG